jgi:hypothetical protein
MAVDTTQSTRIRSLTLLPFPFGQLGLCATPSPLLRVPNHLHPSYVQYLIPFGRGSQVTHFLTSRSIDEILLFSILNVFVTSHSLDEMSSLS